MALTGALAESKLPATLHLGNAPRAEGKLGGSAHPEQRWHAAVPMLGDNHCPSSHADLGAACLGKVPDWPWAHPFSSHLRDALASTHLPAPLVPALGQGRLGG